MNEKYYEQLLRRKVEQIGALCLKLECPGYTGMPDRLILLPGERVIFAETKRPGEKERARQLYVQGKLRKFGFTVFSSVDSREKIDQIADVCRQWMGRR